MDMNIIGWIVIGFLAGSISGWFVGVRSAQGCLPTILLVRVVLRAIET
jgi:uncharacterized membrane protein YeaQ/YmgE (transglycosylase-associated protein family)